MEDEQNAHGEPIFKLLNPDESKPTSMSTNKGQGQPTSVLSVRLFSIGYLIGQRLTFCFWKMGNGPGRFPEQI